MTNKKLSLMTERTLPRFVVEEYPKFVQFLKHYFEFLEREGGEFTAIDTLLETTDIDQTVDQYLDFYRSEYLVGFPETLAVDVRFLVKKIKDFYSSKGTEKSFEFLFRTLFDAPVEFYYPKVDMLRVSDGAWVQPYYVIPERLNVTDSNPDLFELIDQKIQGQTSGATAYIDERKLLTISFPELIENSSFGLVNTPWRTFGDATITLNPSLKNLNCTKSGTSTSGIEADIYVSDSSFIDLMMNISSFSDNSVSANLDIEIDGVNVGNITDTGVSKLEALSVTPLSTVNVKITMLGDDDWSIIFDEISMKNNASVLMIYGSSLSELDGEFIGGEEIKVISARFDDNGDPLPEIPDFKIMDTIRGQSAIFQPAGRYADTGGHLSSTKKIQDSYYYQDFSYELISEIPLKYYTEIVKDLVHPAGFQMFGKVEKKSVDIISMQDLVNFFEILIEWENEVDRSVDRVYDVSKYETFKDVDTTHSERNDWDYFYKNKENYQYDSLEIGDMDNYTFADFDDLQSNNMNMVFVDGKKIPSDQYTILDKEVTFKNAPPKSLYTAHDSLEMNIEVVHLAYTLQSPSIFVTDGVNLRFRLNDDLVIGKHYEVLVFVDGIYVNYDSGFSIEQYPHNGITVSDIIFTQIYPLDMVVDVVVLDGNMVKGNSYKPAIIYSGLPDGAISNGNPFPIENMMDTNNAEELMLFVNGQKVNSKTSYSIYYDIEREEYMVRPLIVPNEIGIVAPYEISVIYLQGSIIDVDSTTADGVTKVFDMKSNFNYMKHTPTSKIEEHQNPDVITTIGPRNADFSRISSTDSDAADYLYFNADIAVGDRVKLYFEVEITEISRYFDFYTVGISSKSFVPNVDGKIRFPTMDKVGKYIYNIEYTVTHKKPLVIGWGHLKGTISNITLSLIDKE